MDHQSPKTFDRGSFAKTDLQPVFVGGKRRINGRQVKAIQALGPQAGLDGQALVDWVITKCASIGVEIKELADIPDGPAMQAIIAGLKSEEVREGKPWSAMEGRK